MTWKVQEMTVLFSVKRDLDPPEEGTIAGTLGKVF